MELSDKFEGCLSCPKKVVCIAEGEPNLCRNYDKPNTQNTKPQKEKVEYYAI